MQHGVAENNQLCCQWEGIEFTGTDLEAVSRAAADVAAVLTSFCGVVSLDPEA